MTTPTSRDGQYAYIRIEGDEGKWKKCRVLDKVQVGELTVPPRHVKHYKAPDDTKHVTYPHISDNDRYKDWQDSLHTGADAASKIHKLAPVKETAWARNWCNHDGHSIVFDCDGREFYAAGFGGIRPADYALVLDLAGQLLPHRRWTQDAIIMPSGKGFLALNQHVAVGDSPDVQGVAYVPPATPKNIVYFNWPDMGIIRTNVTFWEQLYAMLPKGKILVSCLGSHGRTGTCLAAFMMASGWAQSSLEAVLSVRAYHCEHAIEHSCQLSFLDDLATFWKLPAEAKKSHHVPYGKSMEALTALTAAAKKG